MNVVSIIGDELGRKNWDLEDQIRYVYNRSCELFTYDERYRYVDSKLKEEIAHREIDLENVTDNRVICYTWSRSVFAPLMKKLFGIKTSTVGDEFHEGIIFNLGDTTFLADANLHGDITRVKMKVSTNGYYPLGRSYDYGDILRERDIKLGHIEDYYVDEKLFVFLHFIRKEYEELMRVSGTELTERDFIKFRMDKILELMGKFKKLVSHYDLKCGMEYLMLKLFDPKERQLIKATTYLNSDNDYEFMTSYNVEGTDEFYIIGNVDGKYDVRKKLNGELDKQFEAIEAFSL